MCPDRIDGRFSSPSGPIDPVIRFPSSTLKDRVSLATAAINWTVPSADRPSISVTLPGPPTLSEPISRSDTNPTASNGSRSTILAMLSPILTKPPFSTYRVSRIPPKGALSWCGKGQYASTACARAASRSARSLFGARPNLLGQFRGSAMLDFLLTNKRECLCHPAFWSSICCRAMTSPVSTRLPSSPERLLSGRLFRPGWSLARSRRSGR